MWLMTNRGAGRFRIGSSGSRNRARVPSVDRRVVTDCGSAGGSRHFFTTRARCVLYSHRAPTAMRQPVLSDVPQTIQGEVMKRLTFTLATLVLAAHAAFAQAPPGPPRGGPPIDRIASELGLNDTQKEEVRKIFEAQRTKHEAEREQYRAAGSRPSPAEMKTLLEQHDQELYQQLSGVLTADQLAKLKQLQADRREHMHRGPPPGAE